MAGDAPLCACAHCVCGCGDATGGATGAGGSASGGGADAAAAPASGPGPGPGPRPRSTAGSASRAVGNAEGTDATDAGFGVGVRSAVYVASSSTSATAGSDTRLVRVDDARATFLSSAATSSRSSRVSFRSVAVPPRTAVSSTSSRAFIAFSASRICPVYSSRRASASSARRRGESREDAETRSKEIMMMSDLRTCTKRATGRVSGALEESRSGGANARRFPAYLAFRPSCWRWRRASRPSARSRPAPSARRRFPNRDSKPWAPNQARPRAWVSRVWAAAGRTGPRRPPPPWRGAGGLGVVLGVAACATSARRTRA